MGYATYKALRQFNVKRHSEAEKWDYRNKRWIYITHSKRSETDLVTGNGTSGCSQKKLGLTVIKNRKPRNNTEARCSKCGWKILYTEGYKMTEQGWNEREYYYHTWCKK